MWAANKNRRILIVDDEPFNIIGLTIILQQLKGYSGIKSLIDTAKNGLDALNTFKKAFKSRKHSYGLIFMDCSMPILDGFESAENIRKFCRKHSMM